jgi:hypothetical protein
VNPVVDQVEKFWAPGARGGRMTEKEANENGVFDCPTCGRLRDASEMPPEEADESQLTGYKRVRLDSPDFMTAAHSLYRASGFKDIGPYPESEIPDEYKPHWIFMERNLI